MQPPRKPTDRHTVFMAIAKELSKRSKDNHSQHGAVIVDGCGVIAGQGYNGPPRLIPDTGIDWGRPAKYPFIIHAEENAIRFATAARGLYGLRDCTLYVTGFPCPACTLRIAAAEIRRVIYGNAPWRRTTDDMDLTFRIATLAGVQLVNLPEYDNGPVGKDRGITADVTESGASGVAAVPGAEKPVRS